MSAQNVIEIPCNIVKKTSHTHIHTHAHTFQGACLRKDERRPRNFKKSVNKGETDSKVADVPASVDWTTKGVVTPVKVSEHA